jgi:hypothetical protein
MRHAVEGTAEANPFLAHCIEIWRHQVHGTLPLDEAGIVSFVSSQNLSHISDD